MEIINDSEKTFIGRIEKGFDFLGYHFSPERLSMTEKTIEKYLARTVRLYEQEHGEPFGCPFAWVICAALGELGKRNLFRSYHDL